MLLLPIYIITSAYNTYNVIKMISNNWYLLYDVASQISGNIEVAAPAGNEKISKLPTLHNGYTYNFPAKEGLCRDGLESLSEDEHNSAQQYGLSRLINVTSLGLPKPTVTLSPSVFPKSWELRK